MEENPYRPSESTVEETQSLWRKLIRYLCAGITPRKTAFCSFCQKSYPGSGPLVEGPGDVFICQPCVVLCEQIFEQERQRLDKKQAESSA